QLTNGRPSITRRLRANQVTEPYYHTGAPRTAWPQPTPNPRRARDCHRVIRTQSPPYARPLAPSLPVLPALGSQGGFMIPDIRGMILAARRMINRIKAGRSHYSLDHNGDHRSCERRFESAEETCDDQLSGSRRVPIPC